MARSPKGLFRATVYIVGLCVLASHALATPGPDDLGDVAPEGDPDGVVDEADVALLLRAIAGDIDVDEAFLERADLAPVTEIDPPSVVPQRVSPNPNPEGPLTIGDAVIVARRAAGLIVFDELNAPPAITLFGDGAIVSIPEYVLEGRVVDDRTIDGGTVDVVAGDTTVEDVPIVPDDPGAMEGSFSVSLTLEEGPVTITARARDADGRLGPAESIEIILDTTPPALTVDAPAEGSITALSAIEVSGTASDESGVTVEVNGEVAVQLPPDLWGVTVALPDEGENVLVAVARDGATPPNETVVTRTVIRDTIPPVLSPDPLPPAVNTPLFTIGGEVSDTWGVAWVRVNGVDATLVFDDETGTGWWSAEVGILEGPNAFTVEAEDHAGNRANVGPLTIVGDFTAPEVALYSAAYVAASPTDVVLWFSEPVYLERFGETDFSPPLFVEGPLHTLTDVHLEEGPNTFDVWVRDVAGNETIELVTVTLDTIPPEIVITRVSNTAFEWDPPDGLDGVVTNAPTALVEGTVSDASGIASVQVNGFDANVNHEAGTFAIAGVPLLPRANVITAVAEDLAGHTSSDSVTVLRDAEGPVVVLDLSRAAYVSNVAPSPPPFDEDPLPARYYRGTSDILVTGSATDPYFTEWVEDLQVRLDGNPLAVDGVPPYDAFSFPIPATVLGDSGLHVLEIESWDGLGNRTLDVQALLAGEWIVPGQTIPNSVGLAIGPEGLDAIAPILEGIVEGMDHDIGEQQIDVSTATITLHGLALCRPDTNPVYPPYPCENDVNLHLSLTPEGRMAITIEIPRLYAGIRTDDWCVFSPRDGRIVGTDTVVSLEVDFVNTPDGVQLQEVPDSVSVVIDDISVVTNVWCTDALLWIIGPWLEGIVASEFEDQIPALLESINEMLSTPLMSDDDTGMALWIARASNDAEAIRLWLDARGDPCPDPDASTNLSDGAGGNLPCPDDSPRLSPGSFAATPNPNETTLPDLDLFAPDGSPVSAQAAANDEFANYMLHEQWAMGVLDLVVDQDFLGDDAPITLDTDALSLFIPDLRRADVVAQVPLGSPVVVEIGMPLPPVLKGMGPGAPVYDLGVGDMFWRVYASADGDPGTGYETLLFTAAVTLRAATGLSIVPGATENEDDVLALDIGAPSVLTGVTGNPLILNEGAIRNAISQLVNMALPTLTGSLSQLALPMNTVRFIDAEIDGPGDDFLVLSGDLVQTVTVTTPQPGEESGSPILIAGTVEGLKGIAGSTVSLWLPYDIQPREATITGTPTANSLTFEITVSVTELPFGESTLRVVSTDGATGRKASVTFDLTRTGSEVVRSDSASCFGCAGTGGGGGALAGLVGLALFLGLRRRRGPPGDGPPGGQASGGRPAAGRRGGPGLLALLAALLLGVSGCSGCRDDPGEEVPMFTGPAVSPDPSFVINWMQIGGPDDGFDVNPDNPGPDNALNVLGPLANEALADAVESGQVLLVVQFPGLTHLPAPGEEGWIDAVAYLGVDIADDPAALFSGHATFAKDPASFDENGDPLIVFRDTHLRATADGTIHMNAGPATFKLSIPMQGSMLDLEISPTYVYAALSVSNLRDDGIDASDGLLGGVIPAAVLATPIEELGLAPLDILVSELDVDLNGDGEIDRRPTAENEDGLSAGLVFSGVPAYLTDAPVNRPPEVTLEPVPETVHAPLLEVRGTVVDPDGDCLEASLVLTVNGGAPVPAELVAADAGCGFAEEVRLVLGSNTIRALATDADGATGSARVVTRLEDDTPPVLVLLGPSGTVEEAEQVVTGIATDDVGILAVQIDVGGELFVVPASDLDDEGHFALPVTLPALGPNLITGQAMDLAENLSEPVTLEVFLEDTMPPVLTVVAARSARERIEGTGPFELTQTDVVIEGTVADNAGLSGLTLTRRLDDGATEPVAFSAANGTFEIPLTLPRGNFEVGIAAEDAAGNRTEVVAELTLVDQVAPRIDVVAPAPLTGTQSQELVLTVTDDWDASFELAVEASVGAEPLSPVPYDEATGTFRRPIVLSLGPNAVVIEATDTSGNLARVEGVIELVDDEPPTLEVFAPENESWTVDETTTVVGRATDNIGQPTVTVEVGAFTQTVTPEADGGFSVAVPLAMGQNTITIFATDGSGLVTQTTRRVERRDPDAVADVTLSVDPEAVAIGNGTPVRLVAEIERMAGGPVPDGTVVTFEASPADLGVLDDTSAATVGGRAEVVFAPGLSSGLVTFTARAGTRDDVATLGILMPSALAVDVCLSEDAEAAGVSFELDVAEEAGFEPGPPSTDATAGLGEAESFHVYNDGEVPTRVLLAGTEGLTGEEGGSPFARLTWPLRDGFAVTEEIVLRDVTVSNVLGVTASADEALSVCGIEHLIGALPPRVTLVRIPSPTAEADHVITGTVEADDLSTVTAVLVHDGDETTLDVSSGTIAHAITLVPGINQIQVRATDEGDRVGLAEFHVQYEPPNEPPEVTITAPGAAVTEHTVVVEGVVSDADDGLEGLVVTVRVGTGTPVTATVDPATGAFAATVTLQDGNNLITVTATDARGASTTVSQNTEVVEPVPPPRITMTSPEDGATFTTSPISVAGRVDDGGNPANITVTMTVNGEPQPISFSPFSRQFSATVAPALGSNVIAVTATDLLEQSDTATRTVIFDPPNDPPEVTITSPSDGTVRFGRDVTVTGTVSDDQPLDELTLTVNGVAADVNVSTGAWSAVVTMSRGPGTLTAEAEDVYGATATASIDVTIHDPVVVVSWLQIGSSTDGFDVSSDPPHALSKAGPDNALAGLGPIANEPLQEQIEGADGDPLILLFEFDGLEELPGPGQSVVVDVIGYIGIDPDGDPTNNFTGDAEFEIDPISFDPDTGEPIMKVEDVVITNSFGVLRVDTFPDNRARFEVTIDSTDPPLPLQVDPAYLRTTLNLGPKGLTLDPGLLGGVIPAATLAIPITIGDMEIVPLEILISDDPANPVPDVDLNHSGYVNTWDATVDNPDGCSVGLVFTAVPASIVP